MNALQENDNVSHSVSQQPAWQNTFEQVMNLWITPEVKRRQEAGTIPKPYDLVAAQVIFHSDGRSNEVRLNEGVRSIGKVKLKKGVSKNAGDPVYANEVESYELFRLPDDEDPNCGHITLRRVADQWTIAFDFIYNKGLSREHLAAAQEFLGSAESALQNNSYRVFVDNMFSASELAAKALLLTTPLPGEDKKMSHGRIQSRYNLQAKMGNVSSDHKDAFNRLAALRSSARYLNGTLSISKATANELRDAVRAAIEFASRRANPHVG